MDALPEEVESHIRNFEHHATAYALSEASHTAGRQYGDARDTAHNELRAAIAKAPKDAYDAGCYYTSLDT
jgi:hypothetical protein